MKESGDTEKFAEKGKAWKLTITTTYVLATNEHIGDSLLPRDLS
jgi:hypothetical protein